MTLRCATAVLLSEETSEQPTFRCSITFDRRTTAVAQSGPAVPNEKCEYLLDPRF
jgi:hypothetical protein